MPVLCSNGSHILTTCKPSLANRWHGSASFWVAPVAGLLINVETARSARASSDGRTLRALNRIGSCTRSKRVTPGTLRSHFRASPNVLRDGALGDRRRATRGTFRFVDPSPDPLEPRRQRHPRDRHHGHDASHLCGYGLCPKHFRGAVRPPVEFSCHQLCGSERLVAQPGSDPFRGRPRLLCAPMRRTLLPNSKS